MVKSFFIIVLRWTIVIQKPHSRYGGAKRNRTSYRGYTRFKSDTPAGTQETNVDAGTQDHDSDSEVDEQVIVVPSFPSNSFVDISRILSQAEAGIRNRGVFTDRDPAGIGSAGRVSAGSTSAGSDPAGSHPAGTFQPVGSFDPAALGDPAASTSVSADFIPCNADEFYTSSWNKDEVGCTGTPDKRRALDYDVGIMDNQWPDIEAIRLFLDFLLRIWAIYMFTEWLKICMGLHSRLEVPGMQDCLAFLVQHNLPKIVKKIFKYLKGQYHNSACRLTLIDSPLLSWKPTVTVFMLVLLVTGKPLQVLWDSGQLRIMD
ncbi:hypothetical protein Tco_1210534 [Tanacetum coccineum]